MKIFAFRKWAVIPLATMIPKIIKFKAFSHLILSCLITAILLWFVVREHQFASFWEMIEGVSRSGVVLYFTIAVLGLYIRALRYYLLLIAVDRDAKVPKIGEMIVVTGIRNALVDFFPARLGELSFFYVLASYGVNLARIALVFALCLALDLVVLLGLIALLLGSSLFFSIQAQVFPGQDNLAAALLLFGTMIVLGCLFLFAGEILHAAAGFASRLNIKGKLLTTVRQRLIQATEHCAEHLIVLRKRNCYPRLLFLTLLLREAKYGSLYVLLISVVKQWGIGFSDISLAISTIAFLVAEASASLPVSGIMGFGAYEGAWSMIFSLSNIEIPAITSVALLVHLITQVVGYLIGFLSIAIFLTREVRNVGWSSLLSGLGRKK